MKKKEIKDVPKSLQVLLSKCSAVELDRILHVLSKNEKFQEKELERVKILEKEKESYKKLSAEIVRQACHCWICHSFLIPIINSWTHCELCRITICIKCTIFIKSILEIKFCKICYNEWLNHVKSGKWLFQEHKYKKQQSSLEIKKYILLLTEEAKNTLQTKSMMDNPDQLKIQIEGLLQRDNNFFPNGYLSPQKEKALTLYNSNRSLGIKVQNGGDENHTLNFTRKRNFLNQGSVVSQNSSMSNLTNSLGIHKSTRDSQSRSSIQSSFSKNTSELFSNDFDIQGDILLKVEYVPQQNNLKITVLRCRNLSIANTRENSTNPYVKFYLLPDKTSTGKRRTSYKKNTNNPIFNEEITYHVNKNNLNERILNISVWHYENVKTNIFLGELNMTLLSSKIRNPQEIWYPLKTRENVPKVLSLYLYQGEILVGLQFILNTKKDSTEMDNEYHSGNFNIFILSGKYIGTEKHPPNTFIKCSMKYQNVPISIRATKVVQNTTNPIWDEIFAFTDIEKDGLQGTEIQLHILNKKRRGHETLGIILLNHKCNETQVSECREKDILLWRRFLNCKDQEIIEDYLPIRSITL